MFYSRQAAGRSVTVVSETVSPLTAGSEKGNSGQEKRLSALSLPVVCVAHAHAWQHAIASRQNPETKLDHP